MSELEKALARIPEEQRHRFVSDTAKYRWLVNTDALLVHWSDAKPVNIRPLLCYGDVQSRTPIGAPRNADGSVNYDYLDAGEWWNAGSGVLGAGWVRNERFGSGAVIPGTRKKAKA